LALECFFGLGFMAFMLPDGKTLSADPMHGAVQKYRSCTATRQ
jgi:hypothetical protein